MIDYDPYEERGMSELDAQHVLVSDSTPEQEAEAMEVLGDNNEVPSGVYGHSNAPNDLRKEE